MAHESAAVDSEAPESKPRAALCFPIWPLLDSDTPGGRASARDLVKTLETALSNFPPSALRIFDEWVAPFEQRFEHTFRPVACAMSGGVLAVTLEGAGELIVDHPSSLTISREVFRIGHARAVRLKGSANHIVAYEFDGDVVTRRDGGAMHRFVYRLETAAVEFMTGGDFGEEHLSSVAP
jgi:hypothetical protein